MTGGELEARLPGLWDTHCHLGDDDFAADRGDVLLRALAAGVERIVVVAAAPAAWEAAIPVPVFAPGAEAPYPALCHAYGLHPHEARLANRDVWRRLSQALARPGTVALGEIGLDYHYDHSPREAQREAFRRQLHLAAALRLPVILHERDAAADLLAILDAEGPPPAGGVWHCFSGDAALAGAAVALGLHLGFGGLLTFARGAEGPRAAAAACPDDRLLLETDAPYLSPVPYRGRRNEPARVADVAAFLAGLRGTTLADVAEASTRNASALFAPRCVA